jgi:hypothetical protein
MFKYKSVAQWPEGTLNGYNDDISEDKHFEYDEAYYVARRLKQEGFGGEGKIFPIDTWVEEIEDAD